MVTTDGQQQSWPGFEVVWRGYAPAQVRETLRGMEEALRATAVERDQLRTQRDHLARQCEVLRSENRELRARVDRICRTPVDPDGLAERLGRMVELAEEEAGELHERNRLADEEAKRRRRELDEQAARRREKVELDFDQAMARRREEAMRQLAEQAATARAEAERIVAEATERARRINAEADHRADTVRRYSEEIVARFRRAGALAENALHQLEPLDDEDGIEDTAHAPLPRIPAQVSA